MKYWVSFEKRTLGLGEYYISCDWGTTNFRLSLVATQTLEVMQTIKTDQGIKTLYDQSPKTGPLDRLGFFVNYLYQQIQKLPLEHQNWLVVISGMASANIGMREIEYANIPIRYTGEDLKWNSERLQNGMEIILISGVKNKQGMMRGEETQAIGLAEKLGHESGVLILPGTHSKHLSFGDGKFTDLKTFMTGELFEVISKHSILSNSIDHGDWSQSAREAFQSGVALGCEGKLTASLFSIRARDVIDHVDKADNFYLLSGLLIGDELSYLLKRDDKVFLAASAQVLALYQQALEVLIDADRVSSVSADDFARALLIGQKKILELNEK